MSAERIQIANEAPPKSKNKIVRLDYLYRTEGMLVPRTKELSDAMDFTYANAESKGGGRRLREIHYDAKRKLIEKGVSETDANQKADDVERAVIGRVRSYREIAIAEYTHLDSLREDIRSSLEQITVKGSDPLTEATSIDSLGAKYLTRFADLYLMIADPTGKSPVKYSAFDKNYTDTSPGTLMRAHVQDYLGNTTLDESHLMVDEALAERYAAMRFWTRIGFETTREAAEMGLGRFAIEN